MIGLLIPMRWILGIIGILMLMVFVLGGFVFSGDWFSSTPAVTHPSTPPFMGSGVWDGFTYWPHGRGEPYKFYGSEVTMTTTSYTEIIEEPGCGTLRTWTTSSADVTEAPKGTYHFKVKWAHNKGTGTSEVVWSSANPEFMSGWAKIDPGPGYLLSDPDVITGSTFTAGRRPQRR